MKKKAHRASSMNAPCLGPDPADDTAHTDTVDVGSHGVPVYHQYCVRSPNTNTKAQE